MSMSGLLLLLTPAASGATGTSATTNANDTPAASGTTTVVGTSARTNTNDTSSASGSTTAVGTSATTNAADSSSASGTSTIVGTSAGSNANDVAAASGTTTVTGTLATTNAPDTSAASGVAGNTTGTVSATNANDTSSAAGIAIGGAVEGGGYVDLPSGRRKTRKERDELREQLGIIPKKAAAIIKREALRQAPIVDDADDARIDRMVAAIERTGLKYRAVYEELLREQIAMQMQDDEEAAVLLLM